MHKLLAGAIGAALVMIAPAASAQARHDPGPRAKAQQQQSRTTVHRVTRTTTTTRDNRYGNWNNRWGARPGQPAAAYRGRQNDWYRHARACQQRYSSYNPRTDSYTVRRGVTRRCTL
ncbi:hypothetical protein [Sphingomonas sp. 3-13AW]|jgi:hypothetical protein|uniref:hypothetical protein n=1 Tax=Sphingomonas sp. 3-13AW TaxID=3050450 RepID=UPI003BB66B61